MDPWQPCSDPEATTSKADNSNSSCVSTSQAVDLAQSELQDEENKSSAGAGGEGPSLSFGDDFQPFVKLPDSQEYLESLERKLKLIQKGGRKGANAESILRSLSQTKESCMVKLLSNSVEKLSTDGDLFEELKVNPILKKLAPEKQALSAEELVHLLKADQLELLLKNINSEDKDPSTPSGEVPSTSNFGVERSENPISEPHSEPDKDKCCDTTTEPKE